MILEPLFTPPSNWRPPEGFPDLTRHGPIAIDLETRDDHLKEKGPGGVRGDGYVLGFSLATQYFKGYWPLNHIRGNNTTNPQKVVFWLKTVCALPNVKVFANALYDLEWLRRMEVEVKGPMWDVQVAEPLLNEEAFSYSLETLSRKYLGCGKDEELLNQALATYGVDKNGIWQLPPEFVGPYAEGDTANTLAVYQKQLPLIEAEGLTEVCQLENDLLPVLLKMRYQGVRIDVKAAHNLVKGWLLKEKELYKQLKHISGYSISSVWAAEQVARGAEALNLSYLCTATGQPSFTDEFLTQQEDIPYYKCVSEIRKYTKMAGYVKDSILVNLVGERLHCQYHPLRRESGEEGGSTHGTRSGRFSSSGPNLQQVPSDDLHEESWKIRALFIPEEGCQWNKFDYSQQEPRVLVHYACLRHHEKAQWAARQYTETPDMDFYNAVLVKLANIPRPLAKKLYLGRSYGMGLAKLARQLDTSEEEARRIQDEMDAQCPFIKQLYYDCVKAAAKRGYIKTLSGRRAHFELWESGEWADNKGSYPLPLDEAKAKWSDKNLKRAGTHKALNRLIQGSSADMTKKSILDIYRELGIVPTVTVHDEIDDGFCPIGDTKRMKEMKEYMEHAYELKVPIIAELKTGKNWGELA